MKNVSKQAGLTLIELMVVVAVVVILASVAYPMYTEQVRKARRSDARSALMQISLAEERYYTAQGQYTTDLGKLDLPADLQAGNSADGYYTVAVAGASTAVFTATATPVIGKSQAGDSTCTLFTINNVGEKTPTTAGCW